MDEIGLELRVIEVKVGERIEGFIIGIDGLCFEGVWGSGRVVCDGG